MPKTIKEFQLNQSTGEVSVEYSDDSTSKFNAADMVTAQTDPVTGGIVISAGQNRAIIPNSLIAAADGVTDDAPALQAAINAVISIATAKGSTYGLPSVVVYGGRYKLNSSITTFPWIEIRSEGSVLFDFTGLANGQPGFVCNNMTSINQDSLKFPANHSPWLNGANGTISILGQGVGTSTSSALKMGNFASGGKPFRDTRIRNIVVTGWGCAQEFGANDTYLFHADNCRFELNTISVKTQSGVNNNSFERMEWISCTFAGCDTVLSHNIDSFDAVFADCSFDFVGDVITFGASSTYCSVRLSRCYFEALGGYIVNGSGLSGTAAANQVSVTCHDALILPRDRAGGKSVNSPSRKLFTGPFSLSFDNFKIRYETRAYIEDGVLIDAGTTVVSCRGRHVSTRIGMSSIDKVCVKDYDFQKDADGTLGSALSAWDLVSYNSSSSALATISGKKALRVIGSSGGNTSNATFRSKEKIPAKAGDVFYVNTCVYANGCTGNITIQAWMEFFDDADTSLGQFPSSANYSFSQALADSTLPNYASAGDRWMDTDGFRAVAPKNTAYGKMRFTVISFDGTLYVSRARAWKEI